MSKKNKAVSTMGRDETHEQGRRSFLRWGLAAGAALGVSHWKVLEIFEDHMGTAFAQEACASNNRSVHIVNGPGGLAWFQLLWPHNDVAAANNNSFAFHAPGNPNVMTVEGTGGRLTLAPEAPFRTFAPERQITAFMAGSNETHDRTPTTTSTVDTGTGLFATCASIQTASPALVPVITVGGPTYRSAPGAPRPAAVGSGAEIVDLFNSAASREGGILRQTPDAELFARRYETFLSLQRASDRTTARRANAVGISTAHFLGQNLADQLRITADDRSRYLNNPGGARGPNRALAEALIVAAKAFRMGLTNAVVINGFADDPHGGFNDGRIPQTLPDLGRTLNAFLADLGVPDPTCAGSNISDNVVLSIHGDTPKTPLQRNNWPDGTPGNSNWTYVLGAGYLRTGWFGGIDRNGRAMGWNPATGEMDGGRSSASLANPAAAAIAYAVARGDLRRLSDFYSGEPITGVISDRTAGGG